MAAKGCTLPHGKRWSKMRRAQKIPLQIYPEILQRLCILQTIKIIISAVYCVASWSDDATA